LDGSVYKNRFQTKTDYKQNFGFPHILMKHSNSVLVFVFNLLVILVNLSQTNICLWADNTVQRFTKRRLLPPTKEEVNAFARICLSVCLSVSKITEKRVHEFA